MGGLHCPLGKDEVQTSYVDFSHTSNGYLRIVLYSVRKVKIYASYLAFIGMGNRTISFLWGFWLKRSSDCPKHCCTLRFSLPVGSREQTLVAAFFVPEPNLCSALPVLSEAGFYETKRNLKKLTTVLFLSYKNP